MKLILTLSLLILAVYARSQAPPRIVALSNGDIYISGYYSGQLVFNSGDTIGTASSTSRGFFLARLDSSGKLKWAREVKGNSSSCSSLCTQVGLCSDPWNNAYIISSFSDSLRFDSTNILYYSDYPKAFIAKYSSNGTFQWVREALGNGYSYGVDIDSDTSGNVYGTGMYEIQSMAFDTLPPLPDSSYINDIYIVKLDSNGNGLWIRQLHGGGTGPGSNHYVNSLATDKNGNTHVAGYFGGTFGDTLFFGTHYVVAHGKIFEIYFAKCNSHGEPMWIKKVDGYPGMDYVNQISAIDSNYIYLTGSYNEYAKFGVLPALNSNPQDFFIASFDYLGTARWVTYGRTYAPFIRGGALGTVVDPNNNIITIGSFHGTIRFKHPFALPTLYLNSDSGTTFLVKNNIMGEALCVTNNDINYEDMTIDPVGNVYAIAGDAGDFGSYQLIISKWDNNCHHLWDSVIRHDFYVGIMNSEQEPTIRVFPNPTSKLTTVEIKESSIGLGHLELYNVSGQLLLKQEIVQPDQRLQLDLSDFINGIYILRIVGDKGTAIRKIVKM